MANIRHNLGTMKVIVTPPHPKLTRTLEAQGHEVYGVARRQLGSVRAGDFQAVMLIDPNLVISGRALSRGRTSLGGLQHLLVELKGMAPRMPRVFVTEHVTRQVARAVVEAGGYLTTLSSAPAILTTLEQQLAGHPQQPAPAQRLRHGLVVPEFHVKDGPIDAAKVAAVLKLAPSALAKPLGVTPSALSRRTTARAAQKGLREIEFVWAALRQELGSDDQIRAWLNAPHPDLDGEPPLALLTRGSATALADYVRSALAGQPT